jgi:hypothetical protein
MTAAEQAEQLARTRAAVEDYLRDGDFEPLLTEAMLVYVEDLLDRVGADSPWRFEITAEGVVQTRINTGYNRTILWGDMEVCDGSDIAAAELSVVAYYILRPLVDEVRTLRGDLRALAEEEDDDGV